jgi:hypothetical protein
MTGPDQSLFGTHLPVLRRALELTAAPVLELGCGDHSTPFLHERCSRITRLVVSYDSDPTWLSRFSHLAGRFHELRPVDGADWNGIDYREQRWGVALVDQHPPAARLVSIAALADGCEFIVVHDSEHPQYFYEPLFSYFPYHWTSKRQTPWTTVLSRLRPVIPAEWEAACI